MNNADDILAVEYIEDLSDYNENLILGTALVILVVTIVYLILKEIKSRWENRIS